MTNAVAPVGLVFAGVDIQQADFGIFLQVVRGLNDVPEVRGKDGVIPGQAGRVPYNRVADRRTIELEGIVSGSTTAELRANVKVVRALFDPTAMPELLVATMEDASVRSIAARTLSTVWVSLPLVAAVSIELESVAPNWTLV